MDQIRALRERRYEERVKSVNNAPVINNATPASAASPSANVSTNAARQAKWRKANSELNKLRAREGMRRKRAKAKGIMTS